MCTFRRGLVRQSIPVKIRENVKFSAGTLEPIKMSYKIYNKPEPASEDKPPLITVHGLLGSKAIWRSHCKALHLNTTPKRKLIAVDARNHGDSPHTTEHTYPHMAEDIKRLLEELQIQKVALLGHSMGGRAVMYFALKHPDVVEKLIVGDISPVSESTTFKSMERVCEVMQNINFPNKDIPDAAARVSVEDQLLNDLKDPSLCMFLLTNFMKDQDGSYKWKANVPALLKNFKSHMLPFSNVENLKYNGPTLFVVGGDSDFVPVADYAKIRRLFPNAHFKTLEGADHWIHIHKPLEFNKSCADFLNT